MIDYAPGMRTIIRDEEWMIKKTEKNSLGNQALYCIGISPLVKDIEAVFLTDLEAIKIVNPAEIKLVPDDSPHYRRTQLFLESQWRQKIPTDTNLHIGNQAAMDMMPFQLEPAQISLQRPRQRILIADTVGLGKTLEAGILMSELIARGKGKRILVVTVKSMMTQFQKEMWNRFTIPLVRLDSKKIHDIRAKLPTNYNPFFYYDKTIVSIDTLKRDIEYRTHLENAYWDIIVIDEAQNVAERGDKQAQRARLAKLLADRSDTMIMLSATPHDGRAKSFASLMNMLDPTAIANPENYTKDDIKGLCIRRFKKDVKDQVSGSFIERRVELQKCKASAKEEIAFDIFAEMQLQMDLNKFRAQGQLFKTSLEKSLFSSPAACIKSIEARLNKLKKKYQSDEIKDIQSLEELKSALERITPADFSRYQELLNLLKSSDYGWTSKTDDRIVIFTERIETMKYLAAQLEQDLKLKRNSVQMISGAMSDAEQQEIVESFGREESPIRVLVASDVASEGLNLHYLSHRLIHFDIPWSLMVFQQRNGRIDRYGQQKQPDIRYLMIESQNRRIKGDMRIIEILITKEEQALKNIGDPALLLGKFSVEDEELVVYDAIESGSNETDFLNTLDSGEAEFDPFEALMAAAVETKPEVQIHTDETLFSDIDYLYQAFSYLNRSESHPVERLSSVSGLDIMVTPDMKKRLTALLPEEAMPQGEYIRLSDDKRFCMKEMKRSMQNNMAETAWPKVQYLWKLHPLFNWVNDKAGLLFGRGEAPLVGLPDVLSQDEIIFIMAGSIPNNKSTPLIDEWFGLRYKNGMFCNSLSMEKVMQITKFQNKNIPNTNQITEEDIAQTSSLLKNAVANAKDYLYKFYIEYQERMYECRLLITKSSAEPRYKHIIVDEGQDFSANALMLLRTIAGEEHENDIFIVGDSHQRIYKNKAILSKCGINIRGRSSILRINYRTTEEIRKSAFALLNGISFDDLDDNDDNYDQCRSLTHGLAPQIQGFNNANDEFSFVLHEIRHLKENGVSAKNICVVARTNKLIDDYTAQFTSNGMRCYKIKRSKSDDRSLDGIRVATMHRVKGLEFQYIFIVAANNRIIPLASSIDHTDTVSEKETITAEKCLLYVALTRAQKGAYISGYGKMSEFIK